ncbi:YopX family protein [Anaerostipes faecalis]|uniref:YopX family protein n=1 Tax=Anaerostipes faecalis TaxID=2738446 RepID=UPI003F0759CC
MNDRYLYRAKRMDNGEWVEGNLITDEHNQNICFIGYIFAMDESGNVHDTDIAKVDPSTICQCCGYKGIYEHDIFECDGEAYGIVFDQDELAWVACGYAYNIQLAEFKPDEINVIGNIFDNPELLEVRE